MIINVIDVILVYGVVAASMAGSPCGCRPLDSDRYGFTSGIRANSSVSTTLDFHPRMAEEWLNWRYPVWHILQYYCGGWSNYIYVYVYDGGSGYWTNQGTYPKKASTQKGVASYSGTSSVTLRSSFFKGHNIYLDGTYVGKEGSGSDILDGFFGFKYRATCGIP
jgi:hypothetical protein